MIKGAVIRAGLRLIEAKVSKPRLLFLLAFFTLALAGVLVRLAFLQILKSSELNSKQEGQSRIVIEMQPARGKIFDRFGRELALDVRLDSLYAVPREMDHKGPVSEELHRILGIDIGQIRRKLQKDKMFVWIARKINPAHSEAIRRLKLDGLGFIKESQRMYPKGETAAHLVGFTGIDNDGLEGVELQYNSYLKGVPGWRRAQRDARQRELISKQIEMVAPIDGFNIHLTIDEVIQAIAEKELAETCRKHNALGGCIVVLEPKTGDILAMANYPLYDPNAPGKAKPEQRRNRAITDIFEPGSVFKMFTLASIIENKTFPMDEKFDCERGAWRVAGRVLHDHKGSGVLTFREVIEKSSNIGTVKGAMRLGGDKLHKTIRGFGFGEKTGIDLAGEVGGIVPHPKNWSKSSIINIPIGHGVAVTPIQLAAAVGALANDGYLMKPRIISKIDDADGRPVQEFEPRVVRRVISRETALLSRSILEGVVSRGTGKKAAVPGFKAAGKTGTAQKILPGGGYSHDHFFASFIGFVPYDEPKLVIIVSIDEPKPIIYGGEVAAPAFSRVAQAVLSYWKLSAQKTPPEVLRTSAAPRKAGPDVPSLVESAGKTVKRR